MTPQAKLDPSHTLSDDTFYLNMGPQHPSTHGVLRLLLRLSGERIQIGRAHV
jgi:NADH:ubiquinone oxidoreductase subunit D